MTTARMRGAVSSAAIVVSLLALLLLGTGATTVVAVCAGAVIAVTPRRRDWVEPAALGAAAAWLASWAASPFGRAPIAWLACLLVTCAAARLTADRARAFLAGTLVVSLWVLFLVALTELGSTGEVRTAEYGGLDGWGGYPEMGLLGTLVLPVTVGLALKGSGVRTIALAAVASLVAAGSVVLSGARAAWVSAVAGAVAALLGTGWRQRVATLVAALLLMVVAASLPRVRAFADPFLSGRPPVAVEARLEAWRLGAMLWRERPLLGWGPGGYRQAFAQQFPANASDARVHAHNHYLHTAVEAGLLGTTAMTIFGVLVLRACWRARTRDLHRLAAALRLGVVCSLCAVAVRLLLDYFDPAGAAARTLVVVAIVAGCGIAIGSDPPATDAGGSDDLQVDSRRG